MDGKDGVHRKDAESLLSDTATAILTCLLMLYNSGY